MAYQPSFDKLAALGFEARPEHGFPCKYLNEEMTRIAIAAVNSNGETRLLEAWRYDIIGESTGAVTGSSVAQQDVFIGILPNEAFFDDLLKALRWV